MGLEKEKSDGKFDELLGASTNQTNQLNAPIMRTIKINTLDSAERMCEKMPHQKMEDRKLVDRGLTTFLERAKFTFKKMSLISKLDFTAFCLFACSYLAFNYYYWTTHYFM